MTTALGATELHYLRKTQSLHSLGRLAANPAAQIPYIISTQSSGCSRELTFEYRRNGLSLWIARPKVGDTPPEKLITWKQIRQHVNEYATEVFRGAFLATDNKWCIVKAGEFTFGEPYTRSDEREREIAELETRLRDLAEPLWHPETTIEREPQQLDLFS